MPTGTGDFERNEIHFLKSHCSHLEFLWLLENHRQRKKEQAGKRNKQSGPKKMTKKGSDSHRA